MKSLFTLALVVVCATIATAQAQIPTKKSVEIIVTSDVADVELYRITAKALNDAGFQIETSDPVLLTIRTATKKVAGFPVHDLRVGAFVDGNQVRLKMIRSHDNLEYEVTPRFKKEWGELVKIAEQIGEITGYL